MVKVSSRNLLTCMGVLLLLEDVSTKGDKDPNHSKKGWKVKSKAMKGAAVVGGIGLGLGAWKLIRKADETTTPTPISSPSPDDDDPLEVVVGPEDPDGLTQSSDKSDVASSSKALLVSMCVAGVLLITIVVCTGCYLYRSSSGPFAAKDADAGKKGGDDDEDGSKRDRKRSSKKKEQEKGASSSSSQADSKDESSNATARSSSCKR